MRKVQQAWQDDRSSSTFRILRVLRLSKLRGSVELILKSKVFFNSPRCIIIIKDMFIVLSLLNYPRLV